MLLSLPEYVKKTIEKLQENGYKAYAVGGCVRDMLMNKTPNDYDVTTDALPEAVESLFERTAPTGLKHGTVTVLGEAPIEVTTFRTEDGYTDFRRPDKVSFVNELTLDLARRDFTVNAIAYCDSEGLIDPFCGKQDIEAGILRAVGDPALRFKEDALRIMRLFRFASQLRFTADIPTERAALELSGGLQNISRERIAAELIKTVCGAAPEAIEPLLRQDALGYLGIGYQYPLKALGSLPNNENIRLSGFITLCGGSAERFAKELKLSNELRSYLIKLEKLLSLPYEPTSVFIKQALRQADERTVCDLLQLRAALYCEDISDAQERLENILQSGEPYSLSQLAIGGRELTALGFTGKAVGKALEALLDRVIADPSLNKKETLKALLSQTDP